MREQIRVKVTTVRQRTTTVFYGVRLPCPDCGREVEMLTTAQALGILATNSQVLGRLLDAGAVHSLQTVSGNIWICKNSLFEGPKEGKEIEQAARFDGPVEK